MRLFDSVSQLQILPNERQIIQILLQKNLPGVKVWAYGSRVNGLPRSSSDLDLVVFTTPPLRQAVSDLRDAFDESNLPFAVDLHVWDDLPTEFHRQIAANYFQLQSPAD